MVHSKPLRLNGFTINTQTILTNTDSVSLVWENEPKDDPNEIVNFENLLIALHSLRIKGDICPLYVIGLVAYTGKSFLYITTHKSLNNNVEELIYTHLPIAKITRYNSIFPPPLKMP